MTISSSPVIDAPQANFVRKTWKQLSNQCRKFSSLAQLSLLFSCLVEQWKGGFSFPLFPLFSWPSSFLYRLVFGVFWHRHRHHHHQLTRRRIGLACWFLTIYDNHHSLDNTHNTQMASYSWDNSRL